MLRTLTLAGMVLAISTLAGCDDYGHHPRWDRGGGYDHGRDHRGDHDHDHGGYHDDDHHWGPH
ncbi:hypothetical protein [Novosphingobium rosa]|uniref:hypothetical protein n=1 Tax=Novosphingobium rosa TaxID=76978 RepID=UPI00082B86F2|nr:hypothetical protein [Novosphingobium rosa]